MRVEVRGKIIKRGGKPFILAVVREIKPKDKPDMMVDNNT